VLTLTRSVGETIRIGDDIEVHVVEVRGGTVRLGFKAPREVAIHREEVYRQIAEANLLAAQVTADSLGALAAFAPSAAAAETVAAAEGAETAAEDEPAEGAPALQICMAQGPAALADAANVSVSPSPTAPTRATSAEVVPQNCV
jgi:carbon storage regulator